ncbi:MAG: glycoside hydrolase family 3 protein [Coriobacteriia bacterium]|nr:glycoside hydrolase family 3 protein [Coriobacteriia bacterium]
MSNTKNCKQAASQPRQHVDRRSFVVLSCAGAVAFAGLVLSGCGNASHGSGSLQGAQGMLSPAEEERLNATAQDQIELRIQEIMNGMSLEHKVAQLFIARPESLVGVDVAIQAGAQTKDALLNMPIGGLIYFGPNLIDTNQTTEMLSNTMQYALDANGIPLFLCVDEEGGTVSRIGGSPGFGVSNVGNMSDVGATNDPGFAQSVATVIAEYLNPLGFNVNFAPVCDIANNPNSDVMFYRSFGSSADQVASMAEAQVRSFIEANMMCSAKHFPGIGAAEGDSHDVSITSLKSIDEMSEVELVPFKAAIDADIPFIMVGHLSMPTITGSNTPAPLCPEIVQGLLRESMGYEGLIITDSLGMASVSEYYSSSQSAVLALAAGCDIALMSPDLGAAYQGVLEAISNQTLSEERIDQSVRRVLRTKLKFLGELFVR